MTVDAQGTITAHFIAHWGVPDDIRPQAIRGGRSFAILEFAPRGSRQTWRYATNGMSSDLQHHPDQHMKVRTELFACTTEKAVWIDDLLCGLAAYPYDYTTYLAEGDTIEVGQALDRDESCFTGVLLAPPGPRDPPSIGVIDGFDYNVLVHQVVGLLPPEVHYAERHTGKRLWEQLLQFGDPVLDRARKAIK
jgi:hypothetical protein